MGGADGGEVVDGDLSAPCGRTTGLVLVVSLFRDLVGVVEDEVLVETREDVLDLANGVDDLLIFVDTELEVVLLADRSRPEGRGFDGGDAVIADGILLLTLVPAEETLLTVRVSNSSSCISPSSGRGL
jgi:hypothetical protein